MKKVNVFNLCIYDEVGRILGVVCISMIRNDILFDIFKYLEELGRIVDATISGSHFYIGGRLKNHQFIEKIDNMLLCLDASVGEKGLHIDVSPFNNLKGCIDFEKIYADNFLD